MRQSSVRRRGQLDRTEPARQGLQVQVELSSRRFMVLKAQRQALDRLQEVQPIGQLTGCTHAAAWISPEGELCYGTEDVGRHVAVEVAERCGLTLVGFSKPGRAMVFTHPTRIVEDVS